MGSEAHSAVHQTGATPHCRYLYHNRFAAGPAFAIAAHEHLFWHVEFVRTGLLETTIAGTTHTCRPGEAILLPPGVPHAFVYRERATTVFSVKFEAHRFALEPRPYALVSSCLVDSLTSALDTLLIGTSPIDGPLLGAVDSILSACMYAVVRAYSPRTDERPAGLAARIRAAVEQAGGTPVTVETLSRELGFSPTYIRMQFRREEGVALKQFIDRQRANTVVKYLSYCDMPIKEIISQLEFADPQCFSRFTRRMTGKCPKQIRASVRLGTNVRAAV